ncbi:MAG: hypothetical protein ACR2G7_13525 [Acidimicrobiales bacterium]
MGALAALVLVMSLAVEAAPAGAVVPGPNGRIACGRQGPGVGRGGDRQNITGGFVYTMNPDGSNQVVLTPDPDLLSNDPSWSPDGTKIAYSRFPNRTEAMNFNAEVYVMNADGSNDTRLTFSPGEDRGTSWSPDGSKIVFHSTRTGNFDIFTMNADGSNQTNITNSPTFDAQPAWSPDGARIAFNSSRDGNFELYTMDPDGTDVFRVTNLPGQESGPNWSPRGDQLVYQSQGGDPAADLDIFRIRANGTGAVQLTNNTDFDAFAAWSPDGRKIVFSSFRDGDGEVYTMNARDGSNQTRITTEPGFDQRCDWGTAPVSP